jgi:hypothetical protein
MKTIAYPLLAAALTLVGCAKPFEAATPTGFVDMGDRYGSDEYRAATADGAVMRVRDYDNDPKGELTFWVRSLENKMRDMGGYALLDKRTVQNRIGQQGTQIRFGHDEGNQPYLYYVTIFVTDAKIYVLEAGGPKAEVERQGAQIDWAVRNFLPK